MVGDDERQLDVALAGALAHAHPSAGHGGDRIGQPAAPAIVQRAGRADDDAAAQRVLRMIGHEAQLAEVDAERLVQPAHPLHRAVEEDRLVVAGRAQLGDQALRLAERVGADQHAAIRMIVERLAKLGDLPGHGRMAEHRQAEGRFGDEHVAGQDFEGRAGRIGAALVVAGDHHPFAGALEQDLRRAENVARRKEGRRDTTLEAERLAVLDRYRACAGLVAQLHDRQRCGGGDRLAVTAARVIAVAVGHQGSRDRPGGVDPAIGRDHMEAVRLGANPCEGGGHGDTMTRNRAEFHRGR